MDEVTFKFVDSVVELFGKETLDRLAQEMYQPLWKAAVDLHHRNRVYYRVVLRMTNQGIKHVFLDENYRPDSSVDLNIIRKNRRFIRIQWIKDYSDGSYWMLLIRWENVQPSGEPEIAKLLGSLAPQIDPSFSFNLIHNSPGCQCVLLPSLTNRVHLRSIDLSYYGPISHDFLKDQINNSPFLEKVTLAGKWPESVHPLLATFCLKEGPRRPVEVELWIETNLEIDINYLRTFFDAWKANGTLQCKLTVKGKLLPYEELQALKAMGLVVLVDPAWNKSTIALKHDEKKSFAICTQAFLDFSLSFYSCECDLP
uniref:FBA_2 domain-containing protein n=1 Tax=Steinernema glaseri TaxID=37863 RepID=A0A1I7Y395_9BILA